MTRIDITKDWCLNMAEHEGDAEIGAGLLIREPPCPECGQPWPASSGVTKTTAVLSDGPTEQVERAFNPGGEKFLLAALEKIAAMPPRLMPSQLIDQFVEMRILAKQAIAYATTPRDCPGVNGMPFTHLFVGDPPHCARCGLAQADYLGEAG